MQSFRPYDKSSANIIVPCGLIEWSLFNDTYKISRNNKDLKIIKKDIAWKSDKTANLSQTSIRKIYRLKV
jgi:cell division protein YceG involved in septum cleavage